MRTFFVIAHEKAERRDLLPAALETTGPDSRLPTLTGPEGGFTDGEVRQAALCRYAPVLLEPRRLRTETAAHAAATTVMTLLGKHTHDGIVSQAAEEDP